MGDYIPVPALVELPEWTEEAIERAVTPRLQWHHVGAPVFTAKMVARGVLSLTSSDEPIAAVVRMTASTRSAAMDVIDTIVAVLRGQASGLRSRGRYGREGERMEASARLVEGLADRLDQAALDEQRRAG